ncbi:hypothetical protein RB653_006264 [Dictyostelium firmibasis]|uniref:allantoinase n=1 Tax=Dictyostelium firmibasis TaxID=79012 RepID=A0AAN7U2M5_9MYCE
MEGENKIKVIKGKKVVINGEIRPATILIRNGIIIDIKEYSIEIKEEHEILIDENELIIMGGLVDSHVHVNEPGRTEWEGFLSATSAAASGGVTTIIDMPLNSSPVTTTYDNLQSKIKSMPGKLRVDVGLLGGIIPGNASEISRMVLEGGVVGFKSFLVHSGIDEFPHVQETDIQEAMDVMKQLRDECGGRDVVMMFHAETEEPIKEATERLEREKADPKLYDTFLQSRPRVSENIAIDKVIELCKKNQVRTHIVHLSSSDAIKSINEAVHHDKVPITAETTYHYLYFVSEQVPYGNTLYKCCPPVREGENKDLLWKAVNEGTIKIIVSDHSPCTLDLKLIEQGDFMKAWGGISSLQLGLPIIWTEAKKRGVSLVKLSEYMSDEPSRLVGLNDRKGSIKIGRDADFVIWDPEESFIVDQDLLMVKNKNSPYHGEKLHGVVHETILRGNKIFKRGDQSISRILGQRLIPTKIHTNSIYPNPTLPEIELLNSLSKSSFIECTNLLFESAPPLANELYEKRPFSSYQQLINDADKIIKSLNPNDKIQVINAHPRIGSSAAQVKKSSSISYREQNCDKDSSIDQSILETLKNLNNQYESKFGFKFVEFVNGRSKSEIIPIIEQRLNNEKQSELDKGLSEMIEISKSRLLKLK